MRMTLQITGTNRWPIWTWGRWSNMIQDVALIERISSRVLFFKEMTNAETHRTSWKLYHQLKLRGFIYFMKGSARVTTEFRSLLTNLFTFIWSTWKPSSLHLKIVCITTWSETRWCDVWSFQSWVKAELWSHIQVQRMQFLNLSEKVSPLSLSTCCVENER